MIAAPEDTLRAWNSLPKPLRARTLAATRFITFRDDIAGDERRKVACCDIQEAAKMTCKLDAWRRFLCRLPGPDTDLLHARLLSRLIVNASGGAMENGGLCLDRNSGIPYLPGSAIKGCARRAAISELQATLQAAKADCLEKIAFVFGWADTDWQPGRKRDRQGKVLEFRSDFCFACTDEKLDSGCAVFEHLSREVAERLLRRLGAQRGLEANRPVSQQLPCSAGVVGFLPAFPLETDPGIELDVITCHHGEYYKGVNSLYASAPDTEDPKPVVMPVVGANHKPIFTFPLYTSARGRSQFADGTTPLHEAHRWLEAGLETFGIGGKTSAGYGWFGDSAGAARTGDDRIAAERAAFRRRSLHPDEAILKELGALPDANLRELVNKFEFDNETLWPRTGPCSEETYQLSLYHFLAVVKPDIRERETGKRFVKGFKNLQHKFHASSK